MRRRWMVQALLAVLVAGVVYADSPLTSTDLASAYADLPAVKAARATRRVEGPVLQFLLGAAPNDRKAAVVNALGWQSPGNAAAFLQGVAADRGVVPEEVKLAQLTAPDRFVLGYLLALEGYAEPAALRPGALDVWGATPMQLLDQAAIALPEDFAVHYVRGLVEAQRAMDESWCSAYLATRRVLDRFPQARRNLRPAAVTAAQSYMESYKAHCDPAPTKAPDPRKPARLDPEHDQIYALARLGDTIVAGTQAGIVVWHPDQRRPLASRDEKICASLLVWRNAVWAGCYGRVVRWDGTGWKGYLQDPARTDDAFAPLKGPAGELLVRNGADMWRYDSERDGFVRMSLDLGKRAYDVLFRRNGELWGVDFLKSVIGPTRTYVVGTDEYPGSGPGKLVEDVTGRLWVMDSDGFLRLNDSSGRFEREAGIEGGGSAVAVDEARGRTWLLDDAPILREKDRSRRPLDLRDLEAMRDLILDERTGDVWIAGWTGLVRLREAKGRWTRDTWRVR